MSYFIPLIFLVTIFNNHILCADVNRLSSEAMSHQLIELLRTGAITRDVEIPFPIYVPDPYKFSLVELSLPGDIFSFNVNISDGSIYGLSSFRLLQLNLSDTEPEIGFNILFPLLKLHSGLTQAVILKKQHTPGLLMNVIDHYELEGNVYHAVPLKGNGMAHFEIYNLQFWGTLYMKTSETSNSILFNKLENGDFSVERIVSHTEFDHNIDNIISALVEDLLADYLNRFSKYLIATYSDTLIHYINEIMLMYDKK